MEKLTPLDTVKEQSKIALQWESTDLQTELQTLPIFKRLIYWTSTTTCYQSRCHLFLWRKSNKDYLLYMSSVWTQMSIFILRVQIALMRPQEHTFPMVWWILRRFLSVRISWWLYILKVTYAFVGAPLALSPPHFLDFTGNWENYLNGLNPNRDIHYGCMRVEPITGSTILLAPMLQINLVLSKFDLQPTIDKLGEKVLPLVWIDYVSQLLNSIM